ncbi:adhesion G-protein coupled receptor G4-like [Amphiura filiformis]|uniref:adhesion G-protein coupled receptor G4-like n=1 Tax=Amphiura filiformis TaxID=82378 RepID=UPI003B214A0C
MLFRTSPSHQVFLTVSIVIYAIHPAVVVAIGTTALTQTEITPTPVSCDPITLRSCPGDVQKLIVPGSDGLSVSWDPPTLEATNCTVEETQSHQSGEFLSPGTTTVSYLFHNIDGDENVYCNFTVNVTIAQCKQDEFQCFTSGRCIPAAGGYNDSGQVCDSFPDCPDWSDENQPNCQNFEEACIEYVAYHDALLFSCGVNGFTLTPMISGTEAPRMKRQGVTPQIWKFTTGNQQNTYISRVAIDISFLYEYVIGDGFFFETGEIEIRITTSKSLHDLTAYTAMSDSDGYMEGYGSRYTSFYDDQSPGQSQSVYYSELRQPLQVMSNEEVTISLAYKPDPLNEPSTPISLYAPCPFCVEVHAVTFNTSSCEGDAFLTCMDNYTAWSLAYNEIPFCVREEVAHILMDVYGNQCPGSCPVHETNDPYLLTWSETEVDQVAESEEKCPPYFGTVGPRGTRQCIEDPVSGAVWQNVTVNDCIGDEDINAVLIQLSQITVTEDNVAQVSHDLAKITNRSGEISATELEAVSVVLESIVDVQSASPEVTTSVIETIDNILNIEDDIFSAIDQNITTRILRSLEEQLTILHKAGTNFTVSRTNIEVKAAQLSQDNIQNGFGFSNIAQSTDSIGNAEIFKDPDDIPADESDTSIALPSEVVLRFSSEVNATAMVPVTFILYRNSKLFQSRRLRNESTTESVRVVGTHVISATIEGLDIYNLSSDQPVVSTYIHKEPENENNEFDNFQCVFWDFDLENGQGDWSNEGCRRVETTESDRSICHCDHLTSLAVIVDVRGQKCSSPILGHISTIGCGISITALIITLITYLAIKSMRTETPQRILICLSFTLLCLYIVFVAGVDRTDSDAGCKVVAVLLHYLTLSSVSWMGVEAVNLYLLIVKVFDAHVSHFMLKACLAAWGVPLIPVIIVLAVDSSQYANDNHCFMKPSYAFYFADLLIIFLILIFNFVMFVMIIYKLTCGRKNTGRSSNRDENQAVSRAITAVAVTAVLGLTWVFGFLTIIDNCVANVIFQVLFCIFNSLQGLLIFLLFCVRIGDIRDVWKRWFCCNQLDKGTGSAGHSNAAYSGAPAASSNLPYLSTHPESVELPSKDTKQENGHEMQTQLPSDLHTETKFDDNQSGQSNASSDTSMSMASSNLTPSATHPATQPESVEVVEKPEDAKHIVHKTQNQSPSDPRTEPQFADNPNSTQLESINKYDDIKESGLGAHPEPPSDAYNNKAEVLEEPERDKILSKSNEHSSDDKCDTIIQRRQFKTVKKLIP